MNHPLYIIVAVEKNYGIGKDGKIPWHLKKEIKFFKETTQKTSNPKKQNMVIMGRTTWESIKPKYRPLKDRKNIVLTRNSDYKAQGAEIYHSLEDAIDSADDKIEKIFIIGGASVYKESIGHSGLTGIYLTKIDREYDCDTFFPKIPEKFQKIKSLGTEKEKNIKFEYKIIRPKPSQ